MPGNPALFAGLVFVIGLLVGSFLNVVIYRLPIMLERDWRLQAGTCCSRPRHRRRALPGPEPSTWSRLGSSCPACRAPIRAWQNIPVLSWLLLGARCRACGARISVCYPLVELATAALSACVAWHFGVSSATPCALAVTWCLSRRPASTSIISCCLMGLRCRCCGRGSWPRWRSDLPPAARCRSAPRGHHRRCCRLSLPVAGVSRVPAGHRQGRHGLRRLQAVCGDRRLARVESTAPRDPAGRRIRGADRHFDDPAARSRPQVHRCRSGRTWRSPAGSPCFTGTP